MPSEAGITDCRVSECDRNTVPRCGTRNRKCSTAVCGQSVTWDHKCVLLSRPEALPWHDSADWDNMVRQIVRDTEAPRLLYTLLFALLFALNQNVFGLWLDNGRWLAVSDWTERTGLVSGHTRAAVAAFSHACSLCVVTSALLSDCSPTP